MTVARSHEAFDVAVDQVFRSADFVEVAARLRPRLREFLRWEILGPAERRLVDQFLSSNGGEDAYAALYVSLWGSFERFVRGVIEGAAQAISSSSAAQGQVDRDVVVKWHMKLSGAALTTVFEAPSHPGFDYDELCRDLGSCTDGTGLTLNSRAFSFRMPSPNAAGLAEAVKRIGVQIDWDDMGNDPALQAHFNVSGPRAAGKRTAEHLEKLQRRRNEFAHNGVEAGVIAASELRDAATFLQIVGRLIAGRVTSQLGLDG